MYCENRGGEWRTYQYGSEDVEKLCSELLTFVLSIEFRGTGGCKKGGKAVRIISHRFLRFVTVIIIDFRAVIGYVVAVFFIFSRHRSLDDMSADFFFPRESENARIYDA